MSAAPDEFDDFLHWFRDASENFWADHRPITLAEQARAGVGGSDWQPGTRWAPLDHAEIARAEAMAGAVFPSDFRLFLATLGVPDRPQIAFFFEGAELTEGRGQHFADWRDPKDITARREGCLERILFDVEKGLWIDAWGTPPEIMAERMSAAQDLFRNAPVLLPFYGHRFVPAIHDGASPPVLSIHQTDAILYAASMRDALLMDFGKLVGMAGYSGIATPPELPDSLGLWRSILA